jgi:hypothetical protein
VKVTLTRREIHARAYVMDGDAYFSTQDAVVTVTP